MLGVLVIDESTSDAMKRRLGLIVISGLVASLMWGCNSREGCILSAVPGYTWRGSLLGEDGCPLSNTEIEVSWRTSDGEVGPFSDVTDDSGAFVGNWWTCGFIDFSLDECVTESDLAETMDQCTVSEAISFMVSIDSSDTPHAVMIEITEDFLPLFRPYQSNVVDLDPIVFAGVNACAE